MWVCSLLQVWGGKKTHKVFWKRCESFPEKWIYECSCSLGLPWVRAHKWAGSCHHDFPSSFFMYSAVECAGAQRGEWLRAEIRWGGRGRYKPQGKPIISTHPGFRDVDQNLPAKTFFIKSTLLHLCTSTLCQVQSWRGAQFSVPLRKS